MRSGPCSGFASTAPAQRRPGLSRAAFLLDIRGVRSPQYQRPHRANALGSFLCPCRVSRNRANQSPSGHTNAGITDATGSRIATIRHIHAGARRQADPAWTRGGATPIVTTWNASLDKQLGALHGEGLSQRECADRLHQGQSTVSRHAKKLGLLWDRAQTKAATAAVVADNRSMRAALETKLLAKADAMLVQLDQPYLVYNFGGSENEYNEQVLTIPPSGDVKNLMASVGIAIAQSLKIAVHDGDPGVGDAIGMLDAIANEIRVAAQ